ncbi:MAG TPA: ATP-binding cassette domain-containing protein [Coriobacteriia bacterium]
MALTLTSMTCDYAGGSVLASRALEDVSLCVESGGLALVLGPTGSGKTTMLRAAAGLLPLAGGSIDVDGARGSTVPRGTVGLVFQRPEAQFFALSVEEDCAFGPRNLGRSPREAIADARDALAAVGLDPDVFGAREPWSLSGGEARRVALAGVLAMRPRYLLLDEPTAGLDAAGCKAVLDVIDRVRESTGVVVVTHDADRFIGRADSVLVLRAGRTAFLGDVPAFMEALPQLVAEGVAEAPDVPRTLLLARSLGAVLPGALTLDAHEAARRLAIALAGPVGGAK